ncbi:MAG: flagellin [Nitrosomonadales bacterium]|nr:flagellin [Nitrosomonadales bacterium]
MTAQILTNIPSLNAQRNLATSGMQLATSLQRLSSGLRINSAKDDAAGMAISERFTSQIRGIDQAARNANDGISLAQTGEGALGSAGGILQRIRELAVQSINATNSASDRAALNNEVSQLASELDRIAATTSFNGQQLLDGSNTNSYQVGANAGEVITVSTTNFRTDSYGNNRLGSLAATALTTAGDLTIGSTAYMQRSSATTTSRIVAANMTLNGALGSANIAWLAGDSARSVAKTINAQASTTGVTATAKTEVDLTPSTTAGNYTLSIQSNNTTAISVSFTTGPVINADGLAAGINAINNVTAQTGVTAKTNAAGTGITLTNASGENMAITNTAGIATLGNGGTTNSTATAAGSAWLVSGEIVLDSDKSFGVVAATTVNWVNNVAASSQLQKTSQVDVSNVDAANRTLALVDGALQAVNGMRAKYGAVQSRFESTVLNLKTASENLSASRSRIRDADFALETANLTRNQILQQAGTAMLAQANALPNTVLQLLK